MERKSILIFAGAGASKAVSPKTYPTTVEFFERLPDKIKSNTLFREVQFFLESKPSSEVLDIEVLLWRLKELEGHFEALSENSNILNWLFSNHRLSKAVSSQQTQIGQTLSLSRQALNHTRRLVDTINACVYDLYSSEPSQEDLEKTWTPLFKSLSKFDARIEVVTTNYDLVLEQALKDSDAVDLGWDRNSISRPLNVSQWRNYEDRRTGLLTKLHGSVNWTRKQAGQILIGAPTFKESHENHAIIYPGFKDVPSQDPFHILHAYFARCVARASVALFIGFAFRDEYINQLCARCTAPVLIVNPAEAIDHPFENSQVKHLQSRFDSKTASAALEFFTKILDQNTN